MSPPAQADSVWDRIAACESGGNWGINSQNGFSGGVQFSASTWEGFGGTRYAQRANRASKSAQIAVAQRVLAVQGADAWPGCAGQAGLSRVNGARAIDVAEPVQTGSRAITSEATFRSASSVSTISHGRLRVDAIMGPETIRAMQRRVGTAPSGVLGSWTVEALQHKVGTVADGIIGTHTMRALQVTIGARRDGARHLNATTVASLQRYLNRH